MNPSNNEDSKPSSVPEKNTVSKERRNWASTRIGKIAAGAVLALEFNPLSNEALRLAALGATLKATGDPVLAATAFGASTLALEGGGGLVTADVLDTPGAKNLVDKSNNLLNKLGASRLPKMNKPTEAAVAMVAGTPTVTFLKHRESPERTRQENRRYAAVVSLGISAVTAAQGLAVAEGIHAPSPETISLAALGAGSFLASWKWARARLNKSSKTPNDSKPELPKLALKDLEFYHKSMSDPMGPQLEGFTPADTEKVFLDSRTIFINISQGKEDYRWPLLTPIDNNSEYLSEYFDGRYGQRWPVLYLSMPPSLLKPAGLNQNDLDLQISEALLDAGESIIVFDELEGQKKLQALQSAIDKLKPGTNLWQDELTDAKNNTKAAVIHFQGRTKLVGEAREDADIKALKEAYKTLISEGKVNQTDPNRTVLLAEKDVIADGEDSELLQRLWEIYREQFKVLVENHPARQAQTYEEFTSMVKSPETLTLVHFDDDEAVSLAMFTDVQACDWLNPSFYAENFPGELVLYFPGIASDIEKRGSRYSPQLIKLVAHILNQSRTNARIVFQCTNISADYVPYLVKRAGDVPGEISIPEIDEICRYNYRALQVKPRRG